jgi:hypothetical protein
MRRAALLALPLAAVAAAAVPAPVLAKHASRTRTPLRLRAPAPANATVAGFELRLVRARKAGASLALARAVAAARLPRGVTVYSVLARQTRSDRVSGALVVANRAPAVDIRARAVARRFVVNIRHEAIPNGYELSLRLVQSADVLGRHRAFLCSKYFRPADLAGAQKLAGPSLPGITVGTVIQSACSSARSGKAYAGEGELRSALNARSGTLALARSSQLPNGLDGSASFNYPVTAFRLLADPGHQLTSCGFAAGSCAINAAAQPNYAVFTVSAGPAPPGTQLAFTLAVSPSIARALPFQFFGIDQAGARVGPLLTSGPPSAGARRRP